MDSARQDDIHPRMSVAADVGSGRDVAQTSQTAPQFAAGKPLGLSDIADHIGARHGGWRAPVRGYGTRGGR